MEDQVDTVVCKGLPFAPKGLNRVEVKEVGPLAGVVVLWRQRLYDLGDVLRQLSLAREELEENEALARDRIGDLRYYSADL